METNTKNKQEKAKTLSRIFLLSIQCGIAFKSNISIDLFGFSQAPILAGNVTLLLPLVLSYFHDTSCRLCVTSVKTVVSPTAIPAVKTHTSRILFILRSSDSCSRSLSLLIIQILVGLALQGTELQHVSAVSPQPGWSFLPHVSQKHSVCSHSRQWKERQVSEQHWTHESSP